MAEPSSSRTPNPERRRPRFDRQALRRIAGDKIFQRGVEYHGAGLVEIVAVEPDRVIAEVQGSELYRTELKGGQDAITGDCTCPAASDWGFCKHMVATALAANALAPGALDAHASGLDRLRAHLRAQGAEALVAMIMRLAERDPALRRGLELAALADESDGATLHARFDEALAGAMRTRGFVGYHEAEGWAQGIGEVLDQIESLIGKGHAAVVLGLVEGFLARLEDALAGVDDSDGQGGWLGERACELHLSACRAAKPDPVTLAHELFALETRSPWGFFDGASGAYADVLGATGLDEYRRLAEAAWSKITPLHAGERLRPGEDRQVLKHRRLESILDGFAVRDSDLDARVALRAKDLSTSYRYLEIAELLSAHGRDADALKWAKEGLWLFGGEPDERLAVCAAELHLRLGQREEAGQLLWQRFERRPSLDLHARLRAAAGKDRKAAEAVTDKAASLLTARLAAPGGQKPAGWWEPPADLLVDILLAARRLAPAWEASRRHGCGARTLAKLAKASERDDPAQAIVGYAQLVEHEIKSTCQRGYEAAWSLLERMRTLREGMGDGEAHATHLAELRQRYKAKRNFIKLLQTRRGAVGDRRRSR